MKPEEIAAQIAPHELHSLPANLHDVIAAAWEKASAEDDEHLARSCREVCEEYLTVWGPR